MSPAPSDALQRLLAGSRDRAAALRPRAAELERLASRAGTARPFAAALRGPAVGVVAEIKRRSPSAGDIKIALDPVAHALAYVAGGAVAVSVLTEETGFGGSLADLEQVAAAVTAPVLRKDFIVDPLQLLEARGAGASAVLLIARAVAPPALRSLAREARATGLETLIEVHDAAELDGALAAGASAVGVNSRDLATFTVDLDAAAKLVARVPRDIPAVAESGIRHRDDVERMADAGADAVLVGESVAAAPNPAVAVRALTGVPRTGGRRG